MSRTRNLSLIVLSFLVNLTATAQHKKENEVDQYIAFRTDAGYNSAGFLSAGISKVGWLARGHMRFSTDCLYGMAEISLGKVDKKLVPAYSIKAGYEYAFFGVLCVGLEVRLMTDFDRALPVFTPKVGLSTVHFYSLTYGYNAFDNGRNTFGIGHNQICLSININRKMMQ